MTSDMFFFFLEHLALFRVNWEKLFLPKCTFPQAGLAGCARICQTNFTAISTLNNKAAT